MTSSPAGPKSRLTPKIDGQFQQPSDARPKVESRCAEEDSAGLPHGGLAGEPPAAEANSEFLELHHGFFMGANHFTRFRAPPVLVEP